MQMWPDLIAKAKQGGLDVIQTYVFWNLHEPQPGKVRTFSYIYPLGYSGLIFSYTTTI
jgi:hypothetical protein